MESLYKKRMDLFSVHVDIDSSEELQRMISLLMLGLLIVLSIVIPMAILAQAVSDEGSRYSNTLRRTNRVYLFPDLFGSCSHMV
jgi:hypothetical protein